jgi:hypothetical protein
LDFDEEINKEHFMIKEDKIINNSFNSGELNYEEFTQTIRVDSRVSSLYEDQLGDIIEYRTMQLLNDEIYKIFELSPYYQKYKNPKRVDKTDMIKMYYYFKEKIMAIKNFSPMEMFIGFAEFFQINYDQLYSEVRVLDKEAILKELNEKYSLKNRIKTKRLF